MAVYRDRTEAGQRLAEDLSHLRDARPEVFGLARGGVVVAGPVAEALGARLEALVVRKIGHPRHLELGVGAMAPDGGVWLDQDAVVRFNVDRGELAEVIALERSEMERRLAAYGLDGILDVVGRTAVVVDDGLATGVTARAAGDYLRRIGARRLVLAVPVAPPATVLQMAETYDEVVCPWQPIELRSVGEWYENFGQTSDEEVLSLLLSHRPLPRATLM